MTHVKIHEATSNAQLGTAEKAKGVFSVLIINEGWGSSGYYSKSVLQESGPKAFPANTHSFLNHPSAEEMWSQPERRIQDLAGVLTEAVWKDEGSGGPGLYADLTLRPSLVDFVNEVKGMVGMSINAMADSKWDTAPDGREGPIIEALLPFPLNSVDMVTVAGRGGKIGPAQESAEVKAADALYLREHKIQVPSPATPPAAGQPPKGPEMAFTPEQEKALADLAAAAPAIIAEAAASKTAREAAAELARKAGEVNPLDAAAQLTEALVASGLTPDSQKDVIADVRLGLAPDKAIERWKAIEARTKAAQPAGFGGVVTESGVFSPSPVTGAKSLNEVFGALFENGYGGASLIEKAGA